MPEDDLSQRDLSAIDDEDLTPDERHEMHRRFDEFVTRMRERAGRSAPEKEKPKSLARWNPPVISRRH